MALQITITNAGRAEIINAENNGTGAVTITEIGFGSAQYAPSKAQTALQAPVKRVNSIAGLAVAADTIHVIAKDESAAAYNVGEFGLFSATGTLVAVYSQPAAAGWILQKSGASTLLLAVDIILESLAATSLVFGDITFLNPPATTSTPGVVELANDDEILAGLDSTRAVTPAGLQSRVNATAASKLDAEDGTDNAKWTSPLRVFQAIAKKVVAATEAIAGIAKIATQAEVTAGTDDTKIVTAKKLRWGFTISLGTNSYIVFPSWLGGITFQFGIADTSSGGEANIQFPIAFPVTCLHAHATLGAGAPAAVIVGSKTPTVSAFQAFASSVSGTGLSGVTLIWFAIGR